MIFFLFFCFVTHVQGACLEFPDSPLRNNCSVVEIANHSASLERYYPECLRCQIQTWTVSDRVKIEDYDQCSTLELRCIQLEFSNQKIFEEFFREGQSYVYRLFCQENGTDQNTLHVILEKHTLEEINRQFIEEIFQLAPLAYRVLIFELSLRDSNVQIQQDLATITRPAIKVILNCGDQIKPLRTVYVVDNQQVTLESKQDGCLTIFPPLPTTMPLTSLIATTSREVLFVSEGKSNDQTAIIALLACIVLCAVVTSLIYCLRRMGKCHRKSSEKDDATSELTISEDISLETPLSLDNKPKLSLKSKRPKRGMRAIQLLYDDI